MSPGNDPAQPAAARIYDYLLGGPRSQILRFFNGFELLEPGLTDVQQWRRDTITTPTRLKIAGAAGRKPR